MNVRARGIVACQIAAQFALYGALIGAGPCGGKDGPTAPAGAVVTSVQLTTTNLNPRIGETSHVGATPVTATGVPVAGVACLFRSSAPGIAPVDSLSGAVTARAVGQATITATCAGSSATVVITVRPALVTLTITMAGAGTGSVFALPALGAALGYEAGTTVTLTANPLTVGAGASFFAGWGGACAIAGANRTCVLVMNSNSAVTATFSLLLTITVNIAGDGKGTVTANPPGFAYEPGTQVTLTATPNTGSTFTGWAGDCAGAAPCVLQVNANRSVTANFSVTTFSTDYWAEFGLFSSNDGCTWRGTMSGPMSARPVVNADGSVSGRATITVNIGIEHVSGSGCSSNPSAFTTSVDITGSPAAIRWTFTGSQSFNMEFNGALANNAIRGSATATRTFQGSGASGTRYTSLTARLTDLLLTP